MFSHEVFEIKEESCEVILPTIRHAIIKSGIDKFCSEIEKSPWGMGSRTIRILNLLERTLVLYHALKNSADFYLHPDKNDSVSMLYALSSAFSYAGEKMDEITFHTVRIKNTFNHSEVQSIVNSKNIIEIIPSDLLSYIRRQSNYDMDDLEKSITAWFHLMCVTINRIAENPENLVFYRKIVDFRAVYENREFVPFEKIRERKVNEGITLDVSIEKIIGNRDYIATGLRMIRDLTAWDPTVGRNPKKFNQVLFGLGRPGSGKTVTANALGNHLLKAASSAGLNARFVTIRRTDWASSYQNASAKALLERFESQIRGFDGIVMYYWPDIDTAFSSRSSGDLRSEEKGILGTAFGLFDGTILPFNGQWMLVCDANYIQMDEATVSRLSQEPHTVKGPENKDDFIRLFRDILIGNDYSQCLEINDLQWIEIADLCLKYDLSGRDAANISRRIISYIEDFEWPKDFFQLDFATRVETIIKNRRKVKHSYIIDQINSFREFRELARNRERSEKISNLKENFYLELKARTEILDEDEKS
ncbi:AAA family ATPase [Myxococcota bacterium]|nr:AAA family ATPase [Myxococcota bacterium]MBU1379562.1 AAA family ATPase [Myxococcota bacterium]MBU1495280.1 AAA family ATPase [Myxococcota bacterium]